MKEEQNLENGITLVELFNMLFRNIYLIIITIAAITLIGIIYTFQFVHPTYTSSSDIMVQVDKTSGEGTSTNDIDLTSTLRIVQTVAEFVQKDFVIDEVIEDLGLDITASGLRKKLSVNYSSTSLFVTIKYEDEDPMVSQRVVNSLISNAIEIANAEFPVLNNVMIQGGSAKIGVYASPNKTLNVIISFIIGGIVGVGAALLLEFLKTTVRNKKELEALIPNYQVIGVIPLMGNGDKGE
ncbi:MAG: Wzz/FepE/Etk N-terminal domain-containing protein [Bacilli bacterium]|nr:Wzz/FepE/Etk N-terminal domain-containing protein [Bacilli bacterium]